MLCKRMYMRVIEVETPASCTLRNISISSLYLHFYFVGNFCILMYVSKPQTENAVHQPSESTQNPAHVHPTISDTVIESHNEESMGLFNAANWTQHSCNLWHLPDTFDAEEHASHNMILNDMLSVEDSTCATTVVRCSILIVCALHTTRTVSAKNNVRLFALFLALENQLIGFSFYVAFGRRLSIVIKIRAVCCWKWREIALMHSLSSPCCLIIA